MEIKNRIKNINPKDYFTKANLHIHTKHSDGKAGFDQIIEEAKRFGYEHIAISDHNTVEGYKTSNYINEKILIPAVEFDCFYQITLLHILGYGIDINHPDLKKLYAKSKAETEFDIMRIFKSRHPKKVIDAIHNAGGVAVLAHPCCCWVPSLDILVKKLVKLGLDGIEVYYPYNRHRGILKFHSRKRAKQLGEKYNLILTGGTDEHGYTIRH